MVDARNADGGMRRGIQAHIALYIGGNAVIQTEPTSSVLGIP